MEQTSATNINFTGSATIPKSYRINNVLTDVKKTRCPKTCLIDVSFLFCLIPAEDMVWPLKRPVYRSPICTRQMTGRKTNEARPGPTVYTTRPMTFPLCPTKHLTITNNNHVTLKYHFGYGFTFHYIICQHLHFFTLFSSRFLCCM